ncbi:MAG: hypothetical protein HYU83_03975 [Chloroflexi bacterium]|nr:hypothetical protein [Chloroflexota bacterium]
MFVIPAESYGYYIVDQGASAQGVRYVGVRVGNFTEGDSSSLKMEACSSSDNTTYTKMMEAKITGNVTDKIWSGFATSHMSFGEGGPTTPEGETITGEFSNSTFTINMSTAQSMLDAFDFANATSLTTTGIFGRNPNPSDSDATSATTYADGFRVNFDYAASPLLNTVSGTFGNGTTVTGIIYAQFNETVGAGQMNYSNTIAGNNNFNSSEAFSVGAADENGDIAILVTDEAADTSGIYAIVSAEDLTPLTIDVPADVNTAVAWAYDWDCTAPSGSSFTTIDASTVDYATCDALSAEIQDGSGKGSSSCFGEGGGEGGGNNEISLTGTYTSTAALPCPADFASPAIAVTGTSPNLTATAGSSVLNITITGPATCSAVLVGDGGCNTCSLSSSNGVAFTVACPRNQQVCNMTLTKN